MPSLSPGGVSDPRRCGVRFMSVSLLAAGTEGDRHAEEGATFAQGSQREERTGLGPNSTPCTVV